MATPQHPSPFPEYEMAPMQVSHSLEFSRLDSTLSTARGSERLSNNAISSVLTSLSWEGVLPRLTTDTVSLGHSRRTGLASIRS